MAEAMTRHTGEVDVHHLGRFAGLGSRHNVRHWGCSCKQARISTSLYRRIYYYLTADERTGDLMRELVDSDSKLSQIVPLRKYTHLFPQEWLSAQPAIVSAGTDWCSFAANWLTEWERTGDTAYRDKILSGMRSIGSLPKGWFTDGPLGYDPRTGRLAAREGAGVSVSHLTAVFGAVELCAELLDLLDVPEFTKAWMDYCRLYNAKAAEQERELGAALAGNNLRVAHSRLTAYAARASNDSTRARRAWEEFFHGDRTPDWPWYPSSPTLSEAGRLAGMVHVQGPDALHAADEAAWMTTNAAAQWSLAAIQNLALAGGYVEEAAQ